MTIEEFEKTAFSAKTKIEYKGKTYEIESLNFEECLFCILDGYWVRCENVKLISN